MSRRPPSLIIDLDGTLVDSAPLIAGIINQMLADRCSPRTVAPADARAFLTQGGSHLVTALLGPDLVDLDSDLADFRTRYASFCEFVHLFGQINYGNNRQQDQHHKKEGAEK